MAPATTTELFLTVSAVFESLGNGVALLDSEMRIIGASPAIRGLLGTPEVEGQSIGSFFDAPQLVESLKTGERYEGDLRVRDGATVRARAAILSDRAFAPAARYVISIAVDDGLSSGSPNGDKERIIRALDANRWRRSAAARALGISRATLWRRMRELGII